MKLKPTCAIQNGKKPHFYEQQNSLSTLHVPKYQKVLPGAQRGTKPSTTQNEFGTNESQKKYVRKQTQKSTLSGTESDTLEDKVGVDFKESIQWTSLKEQQEKSDFFSTQTTNVRLSKDLELKSNLVNITKD